MRHTGNRIGGSNPSLSAKAVEIVSLFPAFSIRPLTDPYAKDRNLSPSGGQAPHDKNKSLGAMALGVDQR